MSALLRIRKDSERPESPPLERENPFKKHEADDNDMYKEFLPTGKYLSRSTDLPVMRIRENRSVSGQVQSMFVETSCFNQTLSEMELIASSEKPRHVLSHSSYAIPYRNSLAVKSQSLISLYIHARDNRRIPALTHWDKTCNDNESDIIEEDVSGSDISDLNISEADKNMGERIIHKSTIAEEEQFKTDDPEEVIQSKIEESTKKSIREKKNVFGFINTVFKSKFSKLNRQRKEGKGFFDKSTRTSFANTDYPLLHTLA